MDNNMIEFFSGFAAGASILMVVFGIVVTVLIIVFWLRTGIKLKSAGKQLENKSLKQAGNSVLYLFWIPIAFVVIAFLLSLLFGFLFGMS